VGSECLRILVASGAFKDVFPPIEACCVLGGAIERAASELTEVEVETLPLADGGEYSGEVLAGIRSDCRVCLTSAVGPTGEQRETGYLVFGDDEVFIDTSLVTRLHPDDEEHRNPLLLTTFGVGQLLRSALDSRPQRIYLGLGGSSTTDAGIGMLQALGAVLLDRRGQPLRPSRGPYLTGADLANVGGIQLNQVPGAWRNVAVEALWDGGISVHDMRGPTRLKVGEHFASERACIVDMVEASMLAYSATVHSSLGGQLRREPTIADPASERGFGCAGGILLSLLAAFDMRHGPGAAFFARMSGLQERIAAVDIVVTGEGRFDNTLCGKGPAAISRLAREVGKPSVLACGTVEAWLEPYFDGALCSAPPPTIREAGIQTMIRCQLASDRLQAAPGDPRFIRAFRQRSPTALQAGFERYFREVLGTGVAPGLGKARPNGDL
jgi:glycerate kinase